MPKKNQKPLTPDQVLDKMAKYCAYQERCVKDVRVNDERFAMAFVRGKVNQSGWGVNKIRFHLMQKGIDKEIIDEALGQTDEEVYRQRLIDILKTKSKTIKAETDFEKKRKLAAYAMQKGFEGSLVWEVVNGICFA